MRALLALLAFWTLAACSAKADNPQAAALMDRIEAQVRLPDEADALVDYARYYALAPDGKVIGIYVTPSPDEPPAADQACAEVTANLELEDVPCSSLPPEVAIMKAGERRWMNDYRDLPAILDGGCSVVNVTFDPKKGKPEHVSCNGSA